MEIKGKVALVTGGGSGMGQAVCRKLKKMGAKIAVLDMNEENTNALAKELDGFSMVCDVTSEQSLEQAYQKLANSFGIPSFCIHCAGIWSAERIVGREGPMSLANFKKIIDVNLVGTFNVMRTAAYYMMKLPLEGEERGVIINTASIAAFEGQLGQAAYSASKGGVVSLTLPAAREMAQFQIRVACIAPGIFETPMMEKLPEKARNSLIEAAVFPKRLGQPEEVAHTVVYIIENPMINGSVIRLDGALRLSK